MEIGHDRNDSIAKANLFKMLKENIHRKLCFNLNTTRYFAGYWSLILFFKFSYTLHCPCKCPANLNSSSDSSLKDLQTADKPGLLHWLLTLLNIRCLNNVPGKLNSLHDQWREVNDCFFLWGFIWCPEWLPGVPQQEYFSLVLYTGVQLGRDGCCQGVGAQQCL